MGMAGVVNRDVGTSVMLSASFSANEVLQAENRDRVTNARKKVFQKYFFMQCYIRKPG